jgi:uncharacterized membrane protein
MVVYLVEQLVARLVWKKVGRMAVDWVVLLVVWKAWMLVDWKVDWWVVLLVVSSVAVWVLRLVDRLVYQSVEHWVVGKVVTLAV